MSDSIPTRIPGLTLRFATQADVGTILSFIKELADYEKLSHEVEADERALRASLFDGRRVAEVVLAVFQGTPVGFALYFHNFSTFLGRPGIYLEDLYVTPAMRGQGIGTAVLAYLAHLARERGCGRLEWAVLDWNAPATTFYRNLGAQPLDEWTVFRLTGSALRELADRF
jgi:GNAT superfamily N-acetyltransferase